MPLIAPQCPPCPGIQRSRQNRWTPSINTKKTTVVSTATTKEYSKNTGYSRLDTIYAIKKIYGAAPNGLFCISLGRTSLKRAASHPFRSSIQMSPGQVGNVALFHSPVNQMCSFTNIYKQTFCQAAFAHQIRNKNQNHWHFAVQVAEKQVLRTAISGPQSTRCTDMDFKYWPYIWYTHKIHSDQLETHFGSMGLLMLIICILHVNYEKMSIYIYIFTGFQSICSLVLLK